MDCGRAGWSVDFYFSPFATQRKEIGIIRSSFDGNPGIRKWEAQTTCDLGWRLPCEPGQFGSATCVSFHRLSSFLMIA